jgi:D-sedoheptulose 7-phosphate isomerase
VLSNLFDSYVKDLSETLERFLKNDLLSATQMILQKSISNTVWVVGNGGSAAIAQHFATDWTKGLKSLGHGNPRVFALTTNTSLLTAIGNDFGFDEIFKSQLEVSGRAGDLLVAISSSGMSPNIISVAKTAKLMEMQIIGLTGVSGILEDIVDLPLKVESKDTQIIEDIHSIFGHLVFKFVEKR